MQAASEMDDRSRNFPETLWHSCIIGARTAWACDTAGMPVESQGRRDRMTQDNAGTQSLVDLQIQLLKLATLISGPMRSGLAEPGGLAVDDVKILMCLGGEGAMAGHEMSELLGIAPMNVSRAVSNLHARGWIERVSDGGDKRRKPVQLTPEGVAAFHAMTPDLGRIAEQLLGGLSAHERTTLSSATAKIIDQINAWQDG
jgi:DNA-binding MarR family transcriptional regulator